MERRKNTIMESPLQCDEELCTIEKPVYRLYLYEYEGTTDQCYELGVCSFQGDTFFFEQGTGIFLQPSDLFCGTMVMIASFQLEDSEYVIHSTPAIDFRQLYQLEREGDGLDFSCESQYLFRFYACRHPVTQQLQYGLSEAWIQANNTTVNATLLALQQLHDEYRQRELELRATEQLLLDIQNQVGLKRKRLESTRHVLQATRDMLQKISCYHEAASQPHENFIATLF